jgi:CRISPR/Cas system CSM-associated protein Csm4 (group 5 of RAMP superfamily)
VLAIKWLDFIILILATFRLTHLIVFDEITSFIRKPFLTATIKENASGQLEKSLK